jgi:hypothetical protein
VELLRGLARRFTVTELVEKVDAEGGAHLGTAVELRPSLAGTPGSFARPGA